MSEAPADVRHRENLREICPSKFGRPQTFMQAEQPQLEVQITQQSQRVNELLFEVTLVITVSAKRATRPCSWWRPRRRRVPDPQCPRCGPRPCPGDSLSERPVPYARETVSDIVNRAGFPQVLLAPVNFEALSAARRRSLRSA